MEFAIVEFVDDKSVGVVPTNWLTADGCYWPDGKYVKLIKERAEPRQQWQVFPMRVLHKYGMTTLDLQYYIKKFSQHTFTI